MSKLPSLHTLRAGVIGAGFIGPVHIEALRRLGVQVTAVCDTLKQAEAVAERWGIPEVYGHCDFASLIASPQVDVVHIASPNRFHARQALAVLKARKHCVCEKPLGMNTGETLAIARSAARAKSVFAVNYNVRFYPAVLELRRRVANGDLGEIIHVHGSYLQDWLLKETDYNWRLLAEEGGSLRAVADIGTHWMDTVSFILGARIEQVLAELTTFHKARKRPLGEVMTFARATRKLRYARYPVNTEDFAHVLLGLNQGTRGNLTVSQVAAGRKNCIRIEVYGSKKSAWWNSEEPESLWFGSRDTANEVAVRNTPAFSEGAKGYLDYPAGHVEGFPDTFKMLCRSVYSLVAGKVKGSALHASAADGHQEVKVCEAILKSHRHRKWIRV